MDKQEIGEALDLARELVRMIVTELDSHDEENEPRDELDSAEEPSVVLLASLMVRSSGKEREAARKKVAEVIVPSDAISRSWLRNNLGQVKAWELINRCVLPQPNLSRRTHYNLACYYTTLASLTPRKLRDPSLDRAVEELEVALEGGELVGWAGRDPSLRLLKSSRRLAFAKAVKQHTPVAPSTAKGKASGN